MSTKPVRSNDATSKAGIARVDMKLEVVVIPVSDVDRAPGVLQEGSGGGRTSRRPACRPVHAAGLLVLGHLRQEPHVGRARFRRGVPDRFRHRGRPGQARRRRHRGERGLPPRPERPGQRSGSRASQLLLARLRSAIPTATAGCCRRSRRGFPGASTVARLRSTPQATWRARFGVRRPPTASTKSASGSATRTGPTGTPRTWRRSRPGRSCRRKRLRRGARHAGHLGRARRHRARPASRRR